MGGALKGIFGLMLVALIIGFIPNESYASLKGVNKATVVLCDVILFFRGKVGRGIAILVVMGVMLQFTFGNISWRTVLYVSVGIGIYFGAEGLAYVMLPATFKGVSGTMPSGKVFNPNAYYTPEEIVREVCPELGMF